MADELERFFQCVVNVHRPEDRLGGPGEAEELIYERVDPIDLVADQVRKGVPKIRVLVTLGQQLRESLNGDKRVLDLMGHPGRERAEAGQPIAPADLQLETFEGCYVS